MTALQISSSNQFWGSGICQENGVKAKYGVDAPPHALNLFIASND